MSSADDNQMRWSFGRGHYEVWYASLSHRPSRTGFWIRYTLEAPTEGHGEPYAELWFARFDREESANTFGIHRRLPISALRAEVSPFRLRLGDAELTSASLRGRLAGDGHEVDWELAWPAPPPGGAHRHLPSFAYRLPFAETLVLAPNLDVATRGTLRVDGRSYQVVEEPLGQSHVWGKKHAYSWAWSHCNAFTGGQATLETLSVRLRRGSLVLPNLTLLSLLVSGDEPITVTRREPWQLPFCRSEYGTGRYFLQCAGPEYKVEAELTCSAHDMIMAEYVDPDGEPAYCHNTGCADARVTVWRRSPFVGRFRQHRTFVSDAGAHFEWAARAGDPLVRKRHVLLADSAVY